MSFGTGQVSRCVATSVGDAGPGIQVIGLDQLAQMRYLCQEIGAVPATRACPVDHGTGLRSQMLIEATSMVPW